MINISSTLFFQSIQSLSTIQRTSLEGLRDSCLLNWMTISLLICLRNFDVYKMQPASRLGFFVGSMFISCLLVHWFINQSVYLLFVFRFFPCTKFCCFIIGDQFFSLLTRNRVFCPPHFFQSRNCDPQNCYKSRQTKYFVTCLKLLRKNQFSYITNICSAKKEIILYLLRIKIF